MKQKVNQSKKYTNIKGAAEHIGMAERTFHRKLPMFIDKGLKVRKLGHRTLRIKLSNLDDVMEKFTQ